MMAKCRLSFSGRRKQGGETASSSSSSSSSSSCLPKEEEEVGVEWEMRPGGMLVQKRSGNGSDTHSPAAAANLRVRVAYGVVRYQISVNSFATFGELKKLLRAETGLEPGEQRLIFRGKERDNGEYLDRCGVRERSKVVLMEDPESRERRMVETRRSAKIQAVHRLIDNVSVEVDRLAEQVSVIEKSIAKGNKVAELQITTLIEMLMRQAVKLDSIQAQGDACANKDSQGQRVQKCVETLDALNVSNAKQKVPVVASTKWETFEPPPSTTASQSHWEIFD